MAKRVVALLSFTELAPWCWRVGVKVQKREEEKLKGFGRRCRNHRQDPHPGRANVFHSLKSLARMCNMSSVNLTYQSLRAD